ncbi:RNA polymerase factor sigma-54 [Alicyclobacillus tolerans]|uniref:RNA polymerase, sigma 54 subunit, RpoN/SigL n=1 Tax=Alicyclobacillus tolerans TaxID=90970 RepID=A0A1M6TZQ4_9BACL|nr:RNA polymerase factor sigma-54 [Alicyclobacillus montanus]SHK62426.1 RNA polymerase, sigma 54 subunit, RpoN/SigL [Alicyclobacillus montanus]
MNLEISLGMSQELSQRLALTPQMTQSIQILSCNIYELRDYLLDAVSQNPCLEVVEPQNFVRSAGGRSGVQMDDWLAARPYQPSLVEHVTQQVRCLLHTSEEMRIAEYLIGSLDESGYLRVPLTEVANGLGQTVQTVERVLGTVQSCDPPGIGARNLQECLSLQVGQYSPQISQPLLLLIQHLPDLAAGRYRQVKKILGIDDAHFEQLMVQLRSLNPRPASGYTVVQRDTLLPDVRVWMTDFGWEMDIEERILPIIRVSDEYSQILHHAEESVRDYVQQQYRALMWLQQCVLQRQRTIRRIVNIVLEVQNHYLQSNSDCLEPLSMRDVALRLDLHPSTVSRAVRGKFLQTPRGTYAMKFFFSHRLHPEEDLSAQAIQQHLKNWIEREPPERPFSDAEIAQKLSVQPGVQLSRRTVAKYRDQLGIPNSSLRKRKGFGGFF